jgi:uncharacterized membrane protein YeaQ/YmgE (transglycosylase-associated protein family)
MRHDWAWLFISALLGAVVGGLIFHSWLMEIRYTERGNVNLESLVAASSLIGGIVFVTLGAAFQHKKDDDA